jgi:DNA polymerase V
MHSFAPDLAVNFSTPIFYSTIKAGFPSPALDYEQDKLNLNNYLIPNPNSTFFVFVDGESMTDAKIQSGDIAIVDRSLEARNGDVIIAVVDDEFTIKRLEIRNRKGETIKDKTKLILEQNNNIVIRLLPENSNFEPLEITENMTFVVWGVVTSVVHRFR